MALPNTLIFVDLPAEDPSAAAIFYAEVLGWGNDPRPEGAFHRMVPGGVFMHKDGTPSSIENLHLAVYNSANARPHPEPAGVEPRVNARSGRKTRTWIMVSADDTPERILGAAKERGATILWQNHYWKEFNGYNHAFEDPWGNEIILWVKAGPDPVIPADYTRE
jgi:predicted enzyme related to lactoylglutathione lyase